MEYLLDISNSYPRFFIFSGEQGFTTYMSTPDLSMDDNKCIEVLFENIEVNFLEDIWYLPVIKNNPNSIIKKVIENIDLGDLSSLLTIILKRAKLVINNVKNLSLIFDSNGVNYFHSQDNNFNIGDRKIWLSGRSMDIINTLLTAEFVFSGYVDFIFNESDIVVKSIDFDEFISLGDIDLVDQAQDVMVKLKNKTILDFGVNGKASKFLGFYYSKEYFSGDENCILAIKDYKAENG